MLLFKGFAIGLRLKLWLSVKNLLIHGLEIVVEFSQDLLLIFEHGIFFHGLHVFNFKNLQNQLVL